jgi:acetolactate synthase-1/3 small subunit
VSPSSIEGIHKFTITTWSDRVTMEKVVKQIEKRIDVLKSFLYTDDEIVYQEIALYKVSTQKLLELGCMEGLIRNCGIRVLELTETCVVFEKTGTYEETQKLFDELSQTIGVLQFIRSGRVAITKSKVERLSDMLASIEKLQ